MPEAKVSGLVVIYNAKVNGGFRSAPPALTPCEQQGICQGAAAPPPALPGLGSASSVGDGNFAPAAPAPRQVTMRVSRLKAVSPRVARMRVRVPGAGRIASNGRALRRSVVRAPRAGAYTVTVRLKPRARKQLSKRGRLKVRARVTYRAKGGMSATRTVKVTFRQSKRGR